MASSRLYTSFVFYVWLRAKRQYFGTRPSVLSFGPQPYIKYEASVKPGRGQGGVADRTVMMLEELMTLMVVMMLVALGTLKNFHDPYSYGPLLITHKLPIHVPRHTAHVVYNLF